MPYLLIEVRDTVRNDWDNIDLCLKGADYLESPTHDTLNPELYAARLQNDLRIRKVWVFDSMSDDFILKSETKR